MDILQARKRALEQQEKDTKGEVRAPEVAKSVEVKEAITAKPDVAPEPAQTKPIPAKKKAKPKSAAAVKPRAAKKAQTPKSALQMDEEIYNEAIRAQELSAPTPVKNTDLNDIPRGAQAPEEIELAPHEIQGLPGTQDMPELPDLSEEEMAGSVELGDVPDERPAARASVEIASEEEAPIDFPEVEAVPEPKPKRAKRAEPQKPPAPEPEEKKEKSEEFWAAKGDGEDKEEKSVADEMPLDFLSFMLGKEEYGVPLQRISEIIKPRTITEVPRVPPFVLGILTLRGVVIPVFDLAKRLSLGNIKIGHASRIIIVYQKEDKVGLLVDRVRDVVRVLPSDIEPPPPVIAGVDMQYLEGVGRAEGAEGFRRIEDKAEETEQRAIVQKARRRLLILLNLERVASM